MKPHWFSLICLALFVNIPFFAASFAQRKLALSYPFAADHPFLTFFVLAVIGIALWLGSFLLITRERQSPYQAGKILSRFIARDLRRDVKIIDTARLGEGIITARVRTTNLLYVTRGLAGELDFEPAEEIAVADLWKWPGRSWGGLADGESPAGETPD